MSSPAERLAVKLEQLPLVTTPPCVHSCAQPCSITPNTAATSPNPPCSDSLPSPASSKSDSPDSKPRFNPQPRHDPTLTSHQPTKTAARVARYGIGNCRHSWLRYVRRRHRLVGSLREIPFTDPTLTFDSDSSHGSSSPCRVSILVVYPSGSSHRCRAQLTAR